MSVTEQAVCFVRHSTSCMLHTICIGFRHLAYRYRLGRYEVSAIPVPLWGMSRNAPSMGFETPGMLYPVTGCGILCPWHEIFACYINELIICMPYSERTDPC